jgi:hypothetical protein
MFVTEQRGSFKKIASVGKMDRQAVLESLKTQALFDPSIMEEGMPMANQ